MRYTNGMESEAPKIDFSPIMRECQHYAKLMKDVAESGEITEEQFDELEGHRISIADTFCFLLFGEKFDEIRKKYMALIAKSSQDAYKAVEELSNH